MQRHRPNLTGAIWKTVRECTGFPYKKSNIIIVVILTVVGPVTVIAAATGWFLLEALFSEWKSGRTFDDASGVEGLGLAFSLLLVYIAYKYIARHLKVNMRMEPLFSMAICGLGSLAYGNYYQTAKHGVSLFPIDYTGDLTALVAKAHLYAGIMYAIVIIVGFVFSSITRPYHDN